MNTNGDLRLSVSSMRRYATCGYAYRLHQQGAPRRLSAASGTARSSTASSSASILAQHRPTRMNRYGQQNAAPSTLRSNGGVTCTRRYLASGNPNTRARAAWLEANPDYATLAEQLATYQATVLGLYTWAQRASVQDFYLRSRTLVREHGTALVLPNAVMVEGNLITSAPEDGDVTPNDYSPDDEEPRSYGVLEAMIGTTRVTGVPDIVTHNPRTRRWRVGDYKTSKTMLTPDEIREDAQLQLYLVLLQQTGIIPVGATVDIGQIYLSDHVEAVWVDASDLLGAPSERLVSQVEQIRLQIEAGIFMPVKGLLNGYLDRCSGCAFAHVCDA